MNIIHYTDREGGITNGKVDELIDALAEHIKKRIDEGNDMENEIIEKTKALAELVSARAQWD